MVKYDPMHFGRHGFTRHAQVRTTRAIDLETLAARVPELEAAGHAKKAGTTFEIDLTAAGFDALIFPGGYGAAKNLSDFAFKGPEAEAQPEIVKVVRAFHAAGKPIGVVAAEGDFERGAAVACIAPGGAEVARGLSNYGSGEARLIARKSTAEIESRLGYVDEPEIIHRDNLILLT